MPLSHLFFPFRLRHHLLILITFPDCWLAFSPLILPRHWFSLGHRTLAGCECQSHFNRECRLPMINVIDYRSNLPQHFVMNNVITWDRIWCWSVRLNIAIDYWLPSFAATPPSSMTTLRRAGCLSQYHAIIATFAVPSFGRLLMLSMLGVGAVLLARLAYLFTRLLAFDAALFSLPRLLRSLIGCLVFTGFITDYQWVDHVMATIEAYHTINNRSHLSSLSSCFEYKIPVWEKKKKSHFSLILPISNIYYRD